MFYIFGFNVIFFCQNKCEPVSEEEADQVWKFATSLSIAVSNARFCMTGRYGVSSRTGLFNVHLSDWTCCGLFAFFVSRIEVFRPILSAPLPPPDDS